MAIRRIGRGFEFDRVLNEYNKFRRDAPRVLANETKNHFLEAFRKGGGQTDASKSGWEPRKPNARRNAGRGILVDTGALRRSISVLRATFKEIIIGTTRIPYAQRHNEGLTDRLGRQMPKREFIGPSKELNEKNKKKLIEMLQNIFK